VKEAEQYFSAIDLAENIAQTVETDFTADNFTSRIELFAKDVYPIINRARDLLESQPVDIDKLSGLVHKLDEFGTDDPAVNFVRNDLLGIIASQSKNFKDAINYFRKSLEIAPSAPADWTHHNLGVAYYEDRQYGYAINEWEREFDIRPDDGTPLIHMAFAYEKLQLVPQVIRTYERFIELFPNDERASGIKDLLEKIHKLD